MGLRNFVQEVVYSINAVTAIYPKTSEKPIFRNTKKALGRISIIE